MPTITQQIPNLNIKVTAIILCNVYRKITNFYCFQVIFLAHFILISLTCMGSWVSSSYLFYNSVLLFLIIWSILQGQQQEPLQLVCMTHIRIYNWFSKCQCNCFILSFQSLFLNHISLIKITYNLVSVMCFKWGFVDVIDKFLIVWNWLLIKPNIALTK